jgi:hypothetical protein
MSARAETGASAHMAAASPADVRSAARMAAWASTRVLSEGCLRRKHERQGCQNCERNFK